VALTVANGMLTIGGLYGPQFDTWYHNGALDGLASGPANDANSFTLSGGYYSIDSVDKLKAYLGYADQSALKFSLDAPLNLTAGLYVPYVSGELRGNNAIISNLSLSQNTSNLGFVGHFRNNSTQATAGLSVSNLSVNGNISGMMNLGLVAGSDWQRNITSANTSGNVTGTDIYYNILSLDKDDRSENNNGSNGWSNTGGVLGYGWGSSTNSTTQSVVWRAKFSLVASPTATPRER